MAISSVDECLRKIMGEGSGCDGNLRERWTDLGTRIVECQHHMSKSLQWNQEMAERYPDSTTPPTWFDPTIAGERWDDDY